MAGTGSSATSRQSFSGFPTSRTRTGKGEDRNPLFAPERSRVPSGPQAAVMARDRTGHRRGRCLPLPHKSVEGGAVERTAVLLPRALNKTIRGGFAAHNWNERRISYWVTSDATLIRKTLFMPAAEQRKAIEAAGCTPFSSHNQTDFVKDRVAVEVQFGKYAFVAYDLFVKHLAFYVGDVIDVGVEILPMKELQQEMSSGVGYYEGELYNLIREGRGVPAVPLILVGVAP